MAAPVIAAGGVCTGVRVVEFVAVIHIVLSVSADPCLSMQVKGGRRETECVRMPLLLRRELVPLLLRRELETDAGSNILLLSCWPQSCRRIASRKASIKLKRWIQNVYSEASVGYLKCETNSLLRMKLAQSTL